MILFWFRRDLRIEDNAGLFHALSNSSVLPVFVFDQTILNKLPKNDARVGFIHDHVKNTQRIHSPWKRITSSQRRPVCSNTKMVCRT